jgi:hypothetical protein
VGGSRPVAPSQPRGRLKEGANGRAVAPLLLLPGLLRLLEIVNEARLGGPRGEQGGCERTPGTRGGWRRGAEAGGRPQRRVAGRGHGRRDTHEDGAEVPDVRPEGRDGRAALVDGRSKAVVPPLELARGGEGGGRDGGRHIRSETRLAQGRGAFRNGQACEGAGAGEERGARGRLECRDVGDEDEAEGGGGEGGEEEVVEGVMGGRGEGEVEKVAVRDADGVGEGEGGRRWHDGDDSRPREDGEDGEDHTHVLSEWVAGNQLFVGSEAAEGEGAENGVAGRGMEETRLEMMGEGGRARALSAQPRLASGKNE